jgi:hypothetical protein
LGIDFAPVLPEDVFPAAGVPSGADGSETSVVVPIFPLPEDSPGQADQEEPPEESRAGEGSAEEPDGPGADDV